MRQAVCLLIVASSLNLKSGSVRREFRFSEKERKGIQINIWLNSDALRRANLH